MKKLKIVLKIKLLLLLLVCQSCFDGIEPGVDCCVYVPPQGVELSVKDSLGNDLLNPENPASFLYEDFRLLRMKNGVEDYFGTESLSHPRFSLYQREDEYRLSMSLYISSDLATTETVIRWSSQEFDVIKAAWDIENDWPVYKKLWVNGELKWELEENQNEIIHLEIIK